MTFKKYLKVFLVTIFTLFSVQVIAQVKIGNNATSINKNAILELETTNKGLLLPRIALTSTTSFAPLTAFVEGMAVYNTNSANDVSPGIYYSDGTKWVKQSSGTLKSIVIANSGQTTFTTPAVITDDLNIKVFRNGTNVEFTKVNANQIRLVLESANDACFAGDEIKIIQTL